nr:hypothetical protein [Tanacetum cinerariifolium]
MPSLFADTHNVVAILEKSDASEGFAQIIDFLNGSYIHYAVTVSPHIYILCIKQFWNTVVVKRSGDVTRLQALVDKKKIVISEDVIREILRLDDAEGVVCLPDEEIFAGVETPLFENMLEVREVDAEEEVQVPAHDDVDQENVIKEIADDVAQPTSPLPQSPVIPPSPPHQSPRTSPSQATEARVNKLERLNNVKSSKLRRLKKVGTFQRIESSKDEENVLNQGRISVDIEKGIELEDTEVQEVVEVVNAAKLITEVATTAVSIPIPAAKPVVAAAITPISAAKPKVLKVVPAAPAVSTRKRKGVIIRDPEEDLHDDTPAETQKLQEEEESQVQAKDVQPKDVPAKGIQYIRRYHGYKKKPQSESEARKNMIDYLKNTEGFKLAFFKGKTYDQIRPIFQARFDANMRFLLKSKEEMEKEQEEIIKSINETPAQKAAKRRRLHEQAKEAEDLKKQLKVVADEDDDVFVEATPIGTKVPVVNYEIVMINNKPRYKIFRANDTHQLYTSFITLLKNFDREDLEDLWKIVKARFSTSKPNNFTNDYLLATLKNMFEKTDAQDVLWRSQQTEHGQALVKSWKLLTSCGVHIITFTTIMFVLLVEKKYPLSRFTLEQLVNVARLQVEEESEMSLELFGFTRQKLLKYQQE